MAGETIKVFLMLSLFGALECALLVPDMQLKRLRARSRQNRTRN